MIVQYQTTFIFNISVSSPVSNIYGLAVDRVVRIVSDTSTPDSRLMISFSSWNSRSSLLPANTSSPTTANIPICSSPFGVEVVAPLAWS
jgi:hypothetical protein